MCRLAVLFTESLFRGRRFEGAQNHDDFSGAQLCPRAATNIPTLECPAHADHCRHSRCGPGWRSRISLGVGFAGGGTQCCVWITRNYLGHCSRCRWDATFGATSGTGPRQGTHLELYQSLGRHHGSAVRTGTTRGRRRQGHTGTTFRCCARRGMATTGPTRLLAHDGIRA